MSINDLEDLAEKIKHLFRSQNIKRKHGQELLLVVENVFKEMELYRENERSLQDSLKNVIENGLEESDVMINYVEFEEKCYKLEIQLNEYKKQLKETEENLQQENLNLKNCMESDRMCFEIREKELLNQVEVANARASLECDEIESTLKRQLVDVTTKLRHSQNVIRTLQLENQNLQKQLASQQKTNYSTKNKTLIFNEPSISSVKNALGRNKHSGKSTLYSIEETDYLERNLQSFHEKPYISTQEAGTGVVPNSREDFVLKNNSSANFTSRDFNKSAGRPESQTPSSTIQQANPKKNSDFGNEEEFVRANVTQNNKSNYYYIPVYTGTTTNSSKLNNTFPLLKQCSDSTAAKRKVVRKRKLYDPDTFEDAGFTD